MPRIADKPSFIKKYNPHMEGSSYKVYSKDSVEAIDASKVWSVIDIKGKQYLVPGKDQFAVSYVVVENSGVDNKKRPYLY